MSQAWAHGYLSGAHCLGGAYAVGPSLLQRIDLLDWTPWVHTGLGEDVVVGILAAAANLRIRGFVEPGDAFGIAWQELPLAPADCSHADTASSIRSEIRPTVRKGLCVPSSVPGAN